MSYSYTDDELAVQITGYLNNVALGTGRHIWSNRQIRAEALGADFVTLDPAAPYAPHLMQALEIDGSDGDDRIVFRDTVAMNRVLPEWIGDDSVISSYTIRAGDGDDVISITSDVAARGLPSYYYVYAYGTDLLPRVIDISGGAGDKTIRINSTFPSSPGANTLSVNIDLQDGDDQVHISGDATSRVSVDVDLGDGNNRLVLDTRAWGLGMEGAGGEANTTISSGSGDDVITVAHTGAYAAYGDIRTGDGNDRVSYRGGGNDGPGRAYIDLGEGNNQLNFRAWETFFDILGGSGNDLIILDDVQSYGWFGNEGTIDLGGGRNTVKTTGGFTGFVELTAGGTNRLDLTGNGDGGWWDITLGDGADTILAGAGAYDIAAGGGADRVQVSAATLNGVLTLEDFFADTGDVLVLNGFDLPRNGVFRSLDQLRALQPGQGDVVRVQDTARGLELTLASDQGQGTLLFAPAAVSALASDEFLF